MNEGEPITLTGTPHVGREALALLERLTGVACVVRDESMRLVWCNEAFAHLSKRDRGELIGTSVHDFIPRAAADERVGFMRRVMETGQPTEMYQFGADQRLLCSVFPIDRASFGHRGVLVMVQEAPVGTAFDEPSGIAVMRTPCLDDLGALSPSELRVLYHVAVGLSTGEIGEVLHRSGKTIEKHIESIHRKLGTGTRAEIVRLAAERGLQAFTSEQWDSIIEGARAVKKGTEG